MKKKLLSAFIFLIVSSVALFVAQSLVLFGIRQRIDFAAYGEPLFWQVYGVIMLIAVALFVFRALQLWETGRVLDVNTNLDESRWLTIDDVKKSDNLTITTLKKLANGKTTTSGIPVYAKAYSKTDVHVILAQPSHVLVIGTTGSGKRRGT